MNKDYKRFTKLNYKLRRIQINGLIFYLVNIEIILEQQVKFQSLMIIISKRNLLVLIFN